MRKKHNQIFLKRRNSNGQWKHEKKRSTLSVVREMLKSQHDLFHSHNKPWQGHKERAVPSIVHWNVQ